MAYATTTDLSNRLGATLYARLTDRVDGTTASATVAQQILDEAEAVLESYLARRYATPVDLGANPELANVLMARALDLAEFMAWKGSPFVSDVPERVRVVYEDTLRWLSAVAAGQATLPAARPPASPMAGDDGPRYSATDRKFTHEELDGL